MEYILNLYGPTNFSQTCSPGPLFFGRLCRFYVQKMILLVLVANFQSTFKFLEFYFVWVKSNPTDDQKKNFFKAKKKVCLDVVPFILSFLQ